MRFYEKIRFRDYLILYIFKKKAFYNEKSLPLLFIQKVLRFFRYATDEIRELYQGDLQYSTNVMKNAYTYSMQYIDNLDCGRFMESSSNLFMIDFKMIFMKFIFSIIYKKCEFCELAMRYALEHQNEKHSFYISSFLTAYTIKLERYGKVQHRNSSEYINYMFSLLLIPGLLWYSKIMQGRIITDKNTKKKFCFVPDETTYRMFFDLFGNDDNIIYYTTKRYMNKELEKYGIRIFLLHQEGYRYLKKRILKYLYLCFRYIVVMNKFGAEILMLFYQMIRAVEETPDGHANNFFFAEHFDTIHAIRNELIRLQGSISIFLRNDTYVIPQYHCLETYQNYDYLCSPGKHIEDDYKRKRAETQVFIKTGPYHPHRGIIECKSYPERIRQLKLFKGDSLSITILATGVMAQTISHETRLMELARRLAAQEGVKVFIRMKPVPPEPKYSHYYESFIKDEKSILLTGAEYELFDFCSVTDLFITAISSSAYELAACDAQVMFVDFMKTPDFYYVWEMLPDIFLSEEDAFDKIMEWIRDSKDGSVRERHREVMKRVKQYVSYDFYSFDKYRENLRHQLQMHTKGFTNCRLH